MLKIRRPLGRLIFNMGIAIPGKTVFLIETAPWFRSVSHRLVYGTLDISSVVCNWNYPDINYIYIRQSTGCRLLCHNIMTTQPISCICSHTCVCWLSSLTQHCDSWWLIIHLQTHMMTSWNGNIFCVTGHLCGEFTGLRWIPRTTGQTQSFDVFFDLRLNKRLSKQSKRRWLETQSRSLWRHFTECVCWLSSLTQHCYVISGQHICSHNCVCWSLFLTQHCDWCWPVSTSAATIVSVSHINDSHPLLLSRYITVCFSVL